MRTLQCWLFPGAVAALIYGLSSLHGNQLAALVGPACSIHHIDKIGHALIYAVFGWSLIRALIPGPGRSTAGRVLVALLAGVAYGAIDEWHQAFVPGRTGDPADWLADAMGCSIAITAWSCLHLCEAMLDRLMILRMRRSLCRQRTDSPAATWRRRMRIRLHVLLQNLLAIETTIREWLDSRSKQTPPGGGFHQSGYAVMIRLPVALRGLTAVKSTV